MVGQYHLNIQNTPFITTRILLGELSIERASTVLYNSPITEQRGGGEGLEMRPKKSPQIR